MAQINTLRPGVFSTYTVTPLYRGGSTVRYAALAAECSLESGRWFASWSEAAAALVEEGDAKAREGIKILMNGGTSRVFCLPVKAGLALEEAPAALAPLAELEDLGAVVCALPAAALPALKELAHSQALAQKEWVAFCGMGDPDEAVSAAGTLQSERMVIVCPGAKAAGSSLEADPLFSAAALAGAVLAQEDPAAPLSGSVLDSLESLALQPSDQQVESMLAGGVTPFEVRGGAVECVRAVTTRTQTDGQTDLTFLPLGTIRVVDHVMASLREGLRALLGGARTTRDGYDAVASQVTIILQEKADQGMLTSFEPPVVTPDSQDPSVCRVEVAFTVAFAVNQIRLNAQIIV